MAMLNSSVPTRRLTLTDARNLMLQGKPWTFRMEFTGPNPNNAGGFSSKFWLATGRARHEPVEIHYGSIGGGTPMVLAKDWTYVETTAPEKEAKGYTYAATPFVRVRASTLNLAAAVANAAPPAPAPAPVVAPPPPPPVVRAAPVSNLPGPWGRISAVQKLADGTWWGLDPSGGKVLQMTKDGARNLVRDHQHITVAGL
jgi:hypothetical protein